MSSAFTQYIRSLEPGGEPPSTGCFEAFWSLLRDALISEMRKRGLWRISPRCLGIYGRSSWAEGDALDEILVDAYAFVIRRLRGLKVQLERRSDIDGLLFLNIRNFLYETQKRHDPLGFRIFTMLQGAMREAIAEKTLYVLEGDRKLRNDTVLAFAPESSPRAVADGAGLAEQVRNWSNDLLPDLILTFGRGVGKVRSRLKAQILDLGRNQGIEAFRFGDVIEPLKSDLRERWSAVGRHSGGEAAVVDDDDRLVTFVRVVPPDAGFEERESFQKLLACVDEAIEQLAGPRVPPEEGQRNVPPEGGKRDVPPEGGKRDVPPEGGKRDKGSRGDLHRLWLCLRSYAADGQSAASGADRGPPSRRALAKHLGIPRNRVPDLLATLGRLVKACRTDISGKTAVREEREGRSAADGEPTKS